MALPPPNIPGSNAGHPSGGTRPHFVKVDRSGIVEGSLPVDADMPWPPHLSSQKVCYDATPVKIPDMLATRAAYSDYDPDRFVEILTDVRQYARRQFRTAARALAEARERGHGPTIQRVLEIWDEIGDLHYTILGILVYGHVILHRLVDETTVMKFVKWKALLEEVLVEYNSHDPYLATGIEEEELRRVEQLADLLAEIKDYILSPEYYRLRKQLLVAGAATETPTIPRYDLPRVPRPPTTGVDQGTREPAPGTQSPTGAKPEPQSPQGQPAAEGTDSATAGPRPGPATAQGRRSRYAVTSDAAHFGAQVNLARRITDRIRPVPGSVLAADAEAAGQRKGKGKGADASVLAASPIRRTVFQVTPFENYTIDLSPGRSLADALAEVESVTRQLVAHSRSLFAEAKAAAEPIEFNIYTGQYEPLVGRARHLHNMNAIRAQVWAVYKPKLKSALPPRFILRNEITMCVFSGARRAGELIARELLMPGAKVTKRVSSSLSTAEGRSEGSSVLDSNSQTASDSFQRSLEHAKEDKNSTSEEVETYLDVSEETQSARSQGISTSYETEYGVDAETEASTSTTTGESARESSNRQGQAGVSGGIGKFKAEVKGSTQDQQSRDEQESTTTSNSASLATTSSVSTGQEVDLEESFEQTTGTERGGATAVNNTRDSTVSSMEAATDDHVRASERHRDVAVTSNTETSSTLTKETSTTTVYENPNADALVRVNFSKGVREYHVFYVLTDVVLTFSNGLVKYTYPLYRLEEVMDTYLKRGPQFEPMRQRLRDLIFAALKVTDFKKRQLDIADTSTGRLVPCFDNYEEILARNAADTPAAIPLADEDARDRLGLWYRYLPGVLLRYKSYELTQDNPVVTAEVGNHLLSVFNAGRAKNDIEWGGYRNDIARIQRDKFQMETNMEEGAMQEALRFLKLFDDVSQAASMRDFIVLVFKDLQQNVNNPFVWSMVTMGGTVNGDGGGGNGGGNGGGQGNNHGRRYRTEF